MSQAEERDAFLAEPDFERGASEEDAATVLSRRLESLLTSAAVPTQTSRTLPPLISPDADLDVPRVGLKRGLLNLPPLKAIAGGSDLALDPEPPLGTADEATSDGEEDKVQFDAKAMADQFHNTLYNASAGSERVRQLALAKARESMDVHDAEYGGLLDGAVDYVKKRMAKKKLKKAEQKQAVAEVKRKQHERDAERQREKLKQKDAGVPLMGTRSREEMLRMQDSIDRHGKKKNASTMNAQEKLFASFLQDYVRKAPGVSLDALESALSARMASCKEAEKEQLYLGALALGVAFGRVRSAFESSGSLRDFTDSLRRQDAVPMSAASAQLFANAALEYARSVHQRATSASANHAEQEAKAADLGAAFAEELLQDTATSVSSSALSASHPAVALASASQRLFATMLGGVVGQGFANQKLSAYWEQPLAASTWKATTLAHFA